MAALPLAVLAQAGPGQALFDLSLEQLLEMQVSVASRYEQPFRDVPATVTVFTDTHIRQLGVTWLSELLTMVPGIQVDYDSNLANRVPQISVRGHHASHVMLLMDGEPMIDHVNTSPFVFIRDYPLHDLERVEVMRGPASSLYGSAATAATINLIPRRSGRSVKVALGENGIRRASFTANGSAGALHYSLSGQQQQSDGERFSELFDQYGAQSVAHDPYRNHTINARIGWRDLSLSINHSRNDQQSFYQFGSLGEGVNYDDSEFNQLALTWAPEWRDDLSGRFTFGTRQYHDEAISLDLPAGIGPFQQDHLRIGPYFSHRVYSLTGQWLWDLNDHHRLTAGFALERADSPDAYTMSNYDVRSPQLSWLGSPTVLKDRDFRFVEDVDRTISAIYLQDEFSGEDWRITAGGRFDHFSDIGNHFSPRISALWWLTPADRLLLSAGEAFLAPAMNRLYTQNNPATLGNRELEPELVRSIDLGYQRNSDRYLATITLFHNRVDDQILRVADGRFNRFLNVGEERATGVETELTLHLDEYWSLRLGWTALLDNQFESSHATNAPDPTDYLSRRLATLAVTHQRGDWSGSLNASWRSEVPILQGKGGSLRLDGALNWRIDRSWSLFVEIDNLLDETLYSAATGSGLGSRSDGTIERATPLRGRELAVGVELRF